MYKQQKYLFNINVFVYPPVPAKMSRAQLKVKNPIVIAKSILYECTEYVWYCVGKCWRGDDWYTDYQATVTEVVLKENWNICYTYLLGNYTRSILHDVLGYSFYVLQHETGNTYGAYKTPENYPQQFPGMNCTELFYNEQWKQNVNAMRELNGVPCEYLKD